MNEEQLTDCYNCCGDKTLFIKGKPQLGCILCKKYGNSKGKLYKEYRYEQIEIHSKFENSNLVQVFTPPKYKCVTCKDTLKSYYRIWLKNKEDPSSYEKSFYNMPLEELPCHQCKANLHNKLKGEKELELSKYTDVTM